MNKRVHRLVFDRKRGMRVPAAEHVRCAGKQAGGQTRAVAVAVASLLAATQAEVADAAQPIRPVVGNAAQAWSARTNNLPGAAGNLPQRNVARWADNYGKPVDLQYGDTTLTINQEDRRVILNWDTFNIGSGYSVHFQQPVGGSALNKIWDTNPTVILGKLTATGEVILENTNGVFFGQTARVEAGRFVATALSLSKEAYLKGIRAQTDGNTPVFGSDADKPKGVVSIEAGAEVKALAGGDVMMIAPKVVNEGSISATGGQVVMAAGQKVYLYSSSDPAQRGLLVSVDGFVPPAAAPEGQPQPEVLPAGTNGIENSGVIRSEKGSINLVGMSIRQNGVLTATTAVKGENGAIYLQASKTSSAGSGMPKPADLGEVELTANSRTEVKLDASGATQKDAETFYRSNIQILGKDIRVRSGARIEAKGGNIDLLATENYQPAGSLSALDGGATFSQDDATLIVERGASIDASGVRDVKLDMSRNQMSGQFFKIELADSPVQRDGVLYRQKVQFDGRNAVTVGNTKGFYTAVERTVDELSTKGGNVRLNSTGNTVLADGAEVDVSGGSVRYQAGVISTSLLRRGDQLIALNNAQADVKYDQLISASQSLAVDGYVQGNDAGSLSIAGSHRTYAGLSGVRAGVVVGPYQRSGQFASRDGYKAEDNAPVRATASRSLYQGPSNLLMGNPSQYASLRPQAGLISIGFDYGDDANLKSQFLSQVNLVGARSAGIATVPEAHTLAGNAFFDALPESVQVSAQEVQQTGAGQLTLMADRVNVAPDVNLNLGASGAFVAQAKQDLTVSGRIEAAGGKVELRSYTGDVHLEGQASLDLAGTELDERGRSAGAQAVSVKGGEAVLQAGQSIEIDSGTQIDVSAGVWRNGKGAVAKGAAGSISLAANTSTETRAVVLEDGETTRTVYPRHGHVLLNGQLSGFDFSSGGALSISGVPSLTLGGQTASSDKGLQLGQDFFSDHGFGTFKLSALGDVTVLDNAQITPTLRNLAFQASSRNPNDRGVLVTQTLEKGLRKGVNLTLEATSQPVGLNVTSSEGYEEGASLTVGHDALIDVGAGGSINLRAGRNLVVDGTLRAQGGTISLSLLGNRGSDASQANASSSADSRGYIADQMLRLASHAHLDASGWAKVYTDAAGRQIGEVLGGGTVSLNYDLGAAVRGKLLAEVGSEIDVSGASGDLTLGRGTALSHISKAAGTINVGATDGFVLLSKLTAKRPDDTVAGGLFQANVSRAGLGDVVNIYGQSYDSSERSVVVAATVDQAAEQALAHPYAGVVAAQSLNEAGFDRIQLRADDRVVLAEGANLVGKNHELRSVSLNTRAIEAEGPGSHLVRAQHVALGDKNLVKQFGESDTLPVSTAATTGEASLAVQAGLIEVYGHSALRGLKQTELAANLAANGTLTRRDGEVRLIGRPITSTGGVVTQPELSGELNFAGELTIRAGQTYATTLSDFHVNGAAGASSLQVAMPVGGSTSQTPLSALGSMTLTAQTINVDGVLRQPFGRIVINGEDTPQLGANSVLSVSGDGVKVPVGTTINQSQWLYLADGSTLAVDPTSPAAISLDQRVLSKGILVKGKSLSIDGRSQMQAQAGGDLVAWEFVPGTGGSTDTLNKANVFAILPNYTYDFAPYDTEIAQATAKAGTQLTAGDQVYIDSANGLLAPGKYTLLPARYAVLPGAVLVSETTVKSAGHLAEGVVRDDGSVTVSGYNTAVGTTISGGADPRLALVLEPESTFRARSEIRVTSINDYLADAEGVSKLPGEAGRIALQSTDSPFAWAARYNLAGLKDKDGKEVFAGGQFDLAMQDMTVVQSGTDAATAKNAVTVEALKTTGADSILLGGHREDTQAGTVVHQTATQVAVAADLSANELIVVGRKGVTVADGVTIRSDGATSNQAQRLIVEGEGAALVASNKRNTALSRDLAGVDRTADDASLTLGRGVQVQAAAVEFDSSAQIAKAEGVAVRSQSFGMGARHIALGGAVKDKNAVVADERLLADKSRLSLRAYDALDLVDGYSLRQSGLTDITLDAPLIRGVGQQGAVATVAAEHVTVRNTSGAVADAKADAGQNDLKIEARPGVADATAEGITLGEGAVKLAFGAAVLQTTGDVVMRGQGGVSTQGDATVVAARVTADAKADHGLTSQQTLRITHGADERTLGDRVGAGGKVQLEGQRVIQDGLIDVASGKIDIHGTGQAGQATTVELTARSETRAAGWVAPAGNDWSVAAPGGKIKVRADAGDVLVNGMLDVSAPVVTREDGTRLGANAGSIEIAAAGLATAGEASRAQVILGESAKLKGQALAAATSGRISVDAGKLALTAAAQAADANRSALDTLARLTQDGGFHQEVAVRVREGNQSLNSTMQATRVQISADAGSLTLGKDAVIDARAERGGVVQLTAGKDLTLSAGSQVLADSSVDGKVGANGGDILLGSTEGWVDLQSQAVVSAQGDDAADGRIVIRAKVQTDVDQLGDQADANRIQVRKIGATLKAADIQVEGVQTYRTTEGNNAHTQTVVTTSRGPITRTVVTLEGKQSVTTTQKGNGIQTLTTTYVTDPTTGEVTTSTVTSSIAFDEGVVPVTTIKKATAPAGFKPPAEKVAFDTPAKNKVAVTQSDALTLGGRDVVAEGQNLMQHQDGIAKAIGLDQVGGTVRAGVEIQTPGDFTLARDVNLLDSLHFGNQATNLTVRAGGNLNLNGSLSDGFASANRADAAATTPVAMVAGPAASFRLVAGADASAANVLATRSAADVGTLTIAAGKVVRTTTGSIEMAAAQDVVLSAGSGSAPVQAAVYVAGGPSADPARASTAERGAWQQFTAHGGRLDVRAGRDMVQPLASQLFNNWFFQAGAKAANVSWASSFDSFKQGWGSFGGGNLSLSAGNDIVNPGVVAPTSARTVASADENPVYSQVVENGGDILVRAGHDIIGGAYFLGRGQGRIEAGGSILKGAPVAGTETETGLVLGLMDGQWSVQSTGDLSLSAVYNPTMLGLAAGKGGRKAVGAQAGTTLTNVAYDTYADNAGLSLSSVAGDIEWAVAGKGDFVAAFLALHKGQSATGEQLSALSGDASERAELMYLPADLKATALQGQISLAINSPSATAVAQKQSDHTNLNLFAGDELLLSGNTASWAVNPGSGQAWTTRTVSAPANSDPSLKSSATKNLLATQLINSTDPQDMGVAAGQDPVRIHAGGDLVFDGLTLNVAKASLISAGGDIVEPSYVGQHQLSTDVTRIAAGGNIVGHLNAGMSREFGVVQVSGPGELQVDAGKNLDLRNAYGIETVGLRQADGTVGVGASLRVAAGTAKSVDAPAFAQRYLKDTGNQQALIAYVQDVLKVSGLSYEQAWTAFQTLSQAHQVAFAEPLVSAAFVQRYIEGGRSSDPVWAQVAHDGGVAVDDLQSDLYKQYTKAQSALVSYVEGVQKVSGLSFEKALQAYRGMSATEQAALVDKKKNLSPAVLAALMAADTSYAYASLWQARVEQARAVNPKVQTGYDSLLFAQFRDDVVMTELKRLGGIVSNVADSSNPLMNARRESVRQAIWGQARDMTEVAGLAAPFSFQGEMNLASSKIHTQGYGDVQQGGIDLFVPGGGVQVGRAAASAFDRGAEEAARRGLIATHGGSIRSYSAGDFQVNSQKAFVVGEGDLLVYSAKGNIDSGRGSNTDLAVPPLSAQTDPFTGGKQFIAKAPTSGSGIGILKNADGTSRGKVLLLAPEGEVRALDAFIQGPEVVLPGKVLGADNIKGDVKGQSAPPAVSVNLAINTGLGTETAAGESKDQIESKKSPAKNRSSLVTVDVLGMGDAEPPAAGVPADDDKKSSCKNEKDCKR